MRYLHLPSLAYPSSAMPKDKSKDKDKDKDKRRVQIEEPSKAASEGDWVEHFSQSKQKKYWTNKSSGESTWKDPTCGNGAAAPSKSRDRAPDAASAANAASSSGGDWQEHFSASKNKKFWKNSVTGESTWKDPHVNPKEAALVSQLRSAMTTGVTLKPISERDKERDQDKRSANEKEKEKDKDKEKVKGDKPKSRDGKAEAPSSSSSGGDWQEHFSASKNKKFWKNSVTGESTWKDPSSEGNSSSSSGGGRGKELSKKDEKAASAASSAAASDWEEHFSQSKQKKYWKNKATGESTWKEPQVRVVLAPSPN